MTEMTEIITKCIDCGNILTTVDYMSPIFDGYLRDWRCTICHNKVRQLENIRSLEDKKYLTVEEEETYMQEVYNSVVGDIEKYMFLTPNWINRDNNKKRLDNE